MRKLLSLFALAALGAAGAAQYKVTLYHESIVNGTTLKPGPVQVKVIDDNQVIISQGALKVESPVRVETVESKYGATSVRYQNGDGKYRVKEIRIGGTNQKLVFDN